MSAAATLEALLREGARAGVYSAAALQVRRGSAAVLTLLVGSTESEGGTALTESAYFDLASLTKVMATTAICMRLCESGRLDLEAPIASTLEDLGDGPRKTEISAKHLLSHTSGLPAWQPLFAPWKEEALRGEYDAPRRAIVAAARRTPLEHPPGARCVYSDLGFLVLGNLLETLSGERIDTLWEQEVKRPLALDEAFYRPLDGPTPPVVFVATERCPWRGRLLEGVVSDGNTFALGGIAPHAGLFATVCAVGTFAGAMLDAAAGRSDWLRSQTVETFWTPDPMGIGATFALGWDTPSPGASQAGAPHGRAVGHLGFSGTSIWIDRDNEIGVVLLTNRIHPSRDDDRIKAIRPRVHDLVWETFA